MSSIQCVVTVGQGVEQTQTSVAKLLNQGRFIKSTVGDWEILTLVLTHL